MQYVHTCIAGLPIYIKVTYWTVTTEVNGQKQSYIEGK